ncbi:MAG: DUF2721 domain-containing protein [Nitrosomonadales bacterium]|jgi:fatty acid desaturase|nr:DUF2721 domain-containing protein [Nitrosomonadales bacterium]MBT6232456.1 DUF2721 domain-containing protein [Nitrosomonadales bacterium]MBT6355844.1 DUF2721 domain-containing protein [Nitrosomonadales bacterium]MCH9771172.1 DUF2721 domain-containing protein [Betaproteobacteria bacterium]
MIEFTEIATVIQLAVAPAFLLTGIGAILAVMSTRLSRIVDRYRILKEGSKKLNKEHKKEIEFLIKRSKWTHWAIALTTVSALLICVLIAMIFIATEVLFNFDQLITILFILAMAFLIFGLLSFLKEVDLSKGVINV